MTFPTRFIVGHRAYVEGGVDDLGMPMQSWADPVSKPVYGWGAPQSLEPSLAGHDRDVAEVELLVPPGFSCGPLDRMVLDGVEYDVIGRPESYDHSPFGWSPGSVVKLKAVNG